MCRNMIKFYEQFYGTGGIMCIYVNNKQSVIFIINSVIDVDNLVHMYSTTSFKSKY